MKLCLSLIAVILITFYPKSKETQVPIVGEFYSNIYSCGDLNTDLSLVREIPAKFFSGEMQYQSEYDVGWKLNFLKNGKIKVDRLFQYYCGFDVVLIEKASWKKIGQNSYKVSFVGICNDKLFKQENKYHIVDLENGIRKLVLYE